jgi:hypothetical protein
MGTITINGMTFSGNSVSIINDRMIIDGVEVTKGLQGVTLLKIEGTVDRLDSSASIEMHGSIGGNVTAGGSIHCDDVGGSVSAGGSVHCGDVSGNISAGGSVRHG